MLYVLLFIVLRLIFSLGIVKEKETVPYEFAQIFANPDDDGNMMTRKIQCLKKKAILAVGNWRQKKNRIKKQ